MARSSRTKRCTAAAVGGQDVGGAQDEQGGGDVADLERGEPGEHAPEPATQHRADLEAQLLAFGDLREPGLADRVADRRRCQQPGNDGDQDRGAHAEQGDEAEREQRADDGAEVIHGALEPVGTP